MSLARFLFGAPKSDWILFGLFSLGIALFIWIAEKIRHKYSCSPEVNRKLIHILTGILILLSPLIFQSGKPLIWMAVLYTCIDFIGVKTGLLKGIHGTQRKSYGTVFYPLTFLILVLLCWENHQAVLISSMGILALADAAAAIVGENMAHPHRYRLGSDEKSIEGSVTMFVTSLLFVSLILPVTAVRDGIDLAYTTALWYGLVTAVMATALEALSSQGSDNLTAPLGSALVIHFLLSHAAPENIRFTVGLGLAALVAFLSFKARFLTADGSVATFILATVIFGIGGWSWSIPILAFFVLSSLLSKLGKNKKKRFGTVFEKTSRRDAGQVLANGGVAGIVLVLFNFFPSPYWYHLYLGALAAVNADTWATEAGVLSKIQPRSIAGFRRVSPGTSGGMTPLGTAAALLGAFVIALCGLAAPAYFIFTLGSPAFWIVIAGGFIGGLVDSVLGATLQAQYRCGVCSKITEKRSHCKEKSTRISGLRWMSNDWVNTFCSIGGAGFVWMARNLIRA